MAEGFKKYFNSTTINGRANVAKATYATFALVYLFYRVRRGKNQPPPAGNEEMKLQPSDSCDEPQPMSMPEPSVEPPKDGCKVCRERKPHNEGDDPRRPLNVSKPQAQPVPQSQSQHHDACQTQVDEAHPARELIAQMHEGASRVLRNVFGAVMGTASGADGDDSSCCTAATAAAAAAAASRANADMMDTRDQLEDEGSDYEANNQLLHRHRRTEPRACVPSNTSDDPDVEVQLKQGEDQTHTQSQSQSQSQSRVRSFDDDFGSEMFFEDFEE